MMRRYYVYILTNYKRTVLYTGITNNLNTRLAQHKLAAQESQPTFTGRYKCAYLIYYEEYQVVERAIAREKEIKNLTRAKKEMLINAFNPKWEFLNERL